MKWFQTLILTIALGVSCIGCKSPDPNPELSDPIYKDLLGRHDGHKKALEEAVKRLEEVQADLAKAEPHTIEMKNARRDLASVKSTILLNEQMERYYRIRAERRKVTGRIAYRKAFEKDEAWPNPNEYNEYMVNNRLRNVQMNWNARVPKLQGRMDLIKKTETKAEEAAPAKSSH